MDKIFNIDCMDYMTKMDDISIDFTLTDIPYDAVNRQSNGLRNLDKCKADILTFDLNSFLENVYRVTKNSIVIFCGKEQFSTVYAFFANKKRHCTSYYLGEVQSIPNEWTAHLFKWCRNGSLV